MNSGIVTLVRSLGFIEGISAFVLFFIAMPLKHIWGSIGKEEFYFIGLAHGILWVMYAIVATIALIQKQITIKQYLILAFASLLPLGPIIADRWILRARA